MKKLIAVIPMGGLGSRFANAGYRTPKPFIRLKNGIPLFINAALSINNIGIPTKFVFVVQEHLFKEYNYIFKNELPTYFSNYKIVVLNKLTRGSSETVKIGVQDEDENNLMIAIDCDLNFEPSDEYIHKIKDVVNGLDDSCCLLSFNSNSKKYSYAKILENSNIVVQTAEKNVISNNALIGAYFFNSIKTFNNGFNWLEKHNNAKELYTSLIYNYIIENKLSNVLLYKVKNYRSYGTPEEFKQNNV